MSTGRATVHIVTSNAYKGIDSQPRHKGDITHHTLDLDKSGYHFGNYGWVGFNDKCSFSFNNANDDRCLIHITMSTDNLEKHIKELQKLVDYNREQTNANLKPYILPENLSEDESNSDK